jgi:hypothetical protein
LELAGGGGSPGKLELGQNDTTFRQGSTDITTTNSWWLVAVSKATGTVTPRIHYYNFSTDGARSAGTTSHENASGTLGNPNSTAGGTMRWGEYNDIDDANIYLGTAAVWDVDIGDAGFNSIISAGLKTSSLYNGTTNPVALWEFNQANATDPVLDLVGFAHSTGTGGAINGTTIDTGNDPPGWTFDSLGAIATQEVRPDADISTTGWTTAPLFSKINDQSDATIITGTLS